MIIFGVCEFEVVVAVVLGFDGWSSFPLVFGTRSPDGYRRDHKGDTKRTKKIIAKPLIGSTHPHIRETKGHEAPGGVV